MLGCSELMTRGLNKAFVGFRHELLAKAPSVASGIGVVERLVARPL